MADSKPWTVKDCFAGPECWCGIIVSPEGEECNEYGHISKADCRYIVDALNRTPGAERNVNERHPAPWAVEMRNGGASWICTETSVGTDDLDAAITCAGGVFGEYDRLFVEAVNSFYGAA